MKPATPLPWKVAGIAPSRYPFYPIASGDLNVAQVDIHARGGSNIDAAYMVHAANAYPRLVDRIRNNLLSCPDTRDDSRDDSEVRCVCAQCCANRALLRELGEET